MARASDSAMACVGLPCPPLWSAFPGVVRRPCSRAAARQRLPAGHVRTRREGSRGPCVGLGDGPPGGAEAVLAGGGGSRHGRPRADTAGASRGHRERPSLPRQLVARSPGGLGRPGHPARRFVARARRRAVPSPQGASPQPRAPAERCRVPASRWASGPTARRRLSPAAPAPDPPPPAAPARTPPRTPRSDGPVRRGSGGPTRWPGRCRSRPRWRPRPPCGRSRGPRP